MVVVMGEEVVAAEYLVISPHGSYMDGLTNLYDKSLREEVREAALAIIKD